MEYKTFAWFCCLICVGTSAWTAKAFCKEHPRLFTVFALFGLVWALLLPYYGENPAMTSDLLSAYGGFLLVYIGGLLALEAQKNDAHNSASRETVIPFQIMALGLFVLLAFPGAYHIEIRGKTLINLTRPQHELIIATLLDVLGYASVAYGYYRLQETKNNIFLITVLATYSIAEISYTYLAWSDPSNYDMPSVLLILFGILKLIFTGILCYNVTLQTLAEPDRKFGKWIVKFFGLR